MCEQTPETLKKDEVEYEEQASAIRQAKESFLSLKGVSAERLKQIACALFMS